MACINAPLLPLPNVVFFPKTALPLYVDSPCYGRMIRDCALRGLPVVISLAHVLKVPADQDGLIRQQLRPSSIGSLGMPSILEEYPDGAMKVLIKGLIRVRLITPIQDLPYPIYSVAVMSGQECEVGAFDGQLLHINNILETWVKRNVSSPIERTNFLNGLESIEHIVNYVSMLLIRDFEIRQTLLETDSLLDRIHLLGALLRDGIPLHEDREVVVAIKKFEMLERLAQAAN